MSSSYHPPQTSPVGRLIKLGVRVVDHAIETGLCLLCPRAVGWPHREGCPVAAAEAETVAARERVKDGRRG